MMTTMSSGKNFLYNSDSTSVVMDNVRGWILNINNEQVIAVWENSTQLAVVNVELWNGQLQYTGSDRHLFCDINAIFKNGTLLDDHGKLGELVWERPTVDEIKGTDAFEGIDKDSYIRYYSY